jgi:hypothetical protein
MPIILDSRSAVRIVAISLTGRPFLALLTTSNDDINDAG